MADLCLTAGVGRVLVDDDLVYLAELAKILWFLQHILITQPRTQSLRASPALAGDSGDSPVFALLSASANRSWPPTKDLRQISRPF